MWKAPATRQGLLMNDRVWVQFWTHAQQAVAEGADFSLQFPGDWLRGQNYVYSSVRFYSLSKRSWEKDLGMDFMSPESVGFGFKEVVKKATAELSIPALKAKRLQPREAWGKAVKLVSRSLCRLGIQGSYPLKGITLPQTVPHGSGSEAQGHSQGAEGEMREPVGNCQSRPWLYHIGYIICTCFDFRVSSFLIASGSGSPFTPPALGFALCLCNSPSPAAIEA